MFFIVYGIVLGLFGLLENKILFGFIVIILFVG